MKNIQIMKRTIILTVIGLMFAGGLSAQNCEAIMLPFFGGNKQKMDEYPQPKFEWRCKYSQNAFYVTDQVPEGAELHALSELTDKMTGEKVTDDFVVDLDYLSYYQYNFMDIQLHSPSGDAKIYFATPKSGHRYLVVRSCDETYRRTEYPQNYQTDK